VKIRVRKRSAFIGVFLLLGGFSLMAGSTLYRRHLRIIQLDKASVGMAFRYHDLKFEGPFGQAIVRDSNSGRLVYPMNEGIAHGLLQFPAFSAPVLLDIPFPTAKVLAITNELHDLVQVSSRVWQRGDGIVLSHFSLHRSRNTLRFLNLCLTPHKTDSLFIQSLSSFKRLEVVWLPQCKCDDFAVSTLIGLSKLRALAIDGANVTDRSWKHFSAMPSLKVLGLGSNTTVSMDQAQQFIDQRHGEFVLFINNAQIRKDSEGTKLYR